jgi:hypothetical protein
VAQGAGPEFKLQYHKKREGMKQMKKKCKIRQTIDIPIQKSSLKYKIHRD